MTLRTAVVATPDVDEEQRVSNIELFFDLVFVFTLTQLTALLTGDLTGGGLVRVVLVFGVLWWMYGAYAWLTNIVPPNTAVRRLGLMAGMAAFLVCAIAIPQAFDSGGLAFGLGYLAVVAVHSVFFARVSALDSVIRFVPFNLGAAVLVVVAGTTGPVWTYGLWVAAVVVQIVTPYLAGAPGHYELRTSHFVERHGLLLIVAFGESVVSVGLGTSEHPLRPTTFLAAILGLALAVTLWWVYFGRDDRAAHRALAEAPPWRRSRLAINAYFVSFIPMLLGIIVVAAGVKRSLGQVDQRLGVASALALAGGVTVYLLGDVVFRMVLDLRPIVMSWVAGGAALLTTALGALVSAAVQLAALAAVVWLALGIEALIRTRAGGGPARTVPDGGAGPAAASEAG